MRDSQGGPFRTETRHQASILSSPVGVFAVTGGPGRFNQGRAQGLIAGSGLPRETFAATGFIARCHTSPLGQSFRTGKRGDSGPDFGSHDIGDPVFHPGNAFHQLSGVLKRAGALGNFSVCVGNVGFSLDQVLQLPPQHSPLMASHEPCEGSG